LPLKKADAGLEELVMELDFCRSVSLAVWFTILRFAQPLYKPHDEHVLLLYLKAPLLARFHLDQYTD
jgi:hypothetical protein